MNPTAAPSASTAANAPAWGSAPNYQAELQSSVSALAPLATTWHGAQNGVSVQQNITQSNNNSASQGVLPAFWGKVESIGKETGSLISGAASWAKTQLVNGLEAPIKFGAALGNGIVDRINVDSIAKQTQELSQRQDSIISAYKSGQLDKASYLKALDQLNQDNANLTSQIDAFQSKTSIDQQNATKSAINVGSDIVTIMTAGLSSPEMMAANREATTMLSSATELSQAAATIEHLAASEAGWSSVSPIAQQALKAATSEVLQAAGKQATGAQLTRAIAADLLLKFPLTYNAMSATGQQVYNELNQNKYGDAVKTIAFNAALMFSGGPIGWGLKQVKGIASDAAVAMGLRPGSILDELSSRIGNGDRLALGKIAQEQMRAGNSSDVKAMIIGLESNLKAAAGNAAGAVNKITDHLSNYIGWGDLKGMTHQEAWDNIVNYWKHADGLQSLKASGRIAGMAADDSRVVVPGRFSTADKNAIAAAVTQGDLALGENTFAHGQQTVQDRLAAWDAYKSANPNAAFANNPNVDKQITHLIQTTEDPQALHEAINNIPTQIGLDGIPADYAAKMAKDGYIAIVPTSHNLPTIPFSETSGKLATNADNMLTREGAKGAGFFVKAAQPIPVLQSVGNFLTKMGLSPEAAGQRVQDIFTSNFNSAASKFGFLQTVGNEAHTGADTLAQLYDYMKSPTGGLKVFGHYVPITDMRQLTTGDIMRALSVSRSDAKIVGDAIMQAYLDVPREVTGLGNKLVDLNFKVNPAAAPLSKLQSAFRFSWNPVFTQARLPLKAEFLAQMETGGKFPTIAGTNRFMSVFFPGQYKELNAIIDNPDFKQLLGGGIGGEADAAATGVKNAASSELPPRTTLLPVAGLVKSMADNVGLDTATFIKQFPTQVQDATQALLHYDKNNSFLNSPLAKTLNMAFFPFRFNVKVTGIMANFLAKQSPAIQYAAIKGVMNAGQYLKTPQGQAWYSQHSDAIALFKYISPLETISSISTILTHPGTISAYGELGGLPFGWIPQATDAAGLTHFGQAYVNPKTGAIAKDYIPTSMYGAINAAMQDLLGSLFTYPGATAGLPSKGSIERRIVGGILPGSNKDFKAVNPTNVTPQDQQFSQVVQQANGTQPTASQPSPATQWSQAINVPPQQSPITTPVPRSTGEPKLKKGQFKPYLLPGQSRLGQI